MEITNFTFRYMTSKGVLYTTDTIYAESLYFAIRKFYQTYLNDPKIVHIEGTVVTDYGQFKIIGVSK